MLASRDLSIAFWSAARVEETSFFCNHKFVSSNLSAILRQIPRYRLPAPRIFLVVLVPLSIRVLVDGVVPVASLPA